MSDSLAIKIAKLLLAEEPGLLNTDMGANARASLALVDNLGSLMAALKVKKGQAYYQQACEAVLRRLDETASDVHRRAEHIAATEPQSSH